MVRAALTARLALGDAQRELARSTDAEDLGAAAA
jgi:hypothetical protein